MKTAQRDMFYTERLLDGLAELCRLHEDDDTTFKIEAAKLLETLSRTPAGRRQVQGLLEALRALKAFKALKLLE